MRSPRLPTLLAALLLTLPAPLLAGCGGTVTAPHSATLTPSTAATGSAPSGTPVRPPARRRTRTPVNQLVLRYALSRNLRPVGRGSGAVVYDLTTHQVLFDARGGVARPPASVEKLYTTTAVLRTLGPGATLQTQILGTGHLGPGGVWHGDLYLKGGGDPTLGDGGFNQAYESGFGPTGSQLAEQIANRGIHRVTGHLFGDESLFDTRRGGLSTGYRPDTPDFGGQLSALTYDHGSTLGSPTPAAFAAKQIAAAMRTLHVVVHASRRTATTPVGAAPLASVDSPPMQVILRLMDVPSDDFIAELLTKQLGVRYGDGNGSIAAGANVISHLIATDYGIHPRILDGSGLSHRDRSTPQQIVTLLRGLWRTPTGTLVLASLPVVGRSGTVAPIAANTAAAGRCSAKTGTLDDVSNLAGICRSRGQQALAFAFFMDGPPNGDALALEGRMVAAVARY